MVGLSVFCLQSWERLRIVPASYSYRKAGCFATIDDVSDTTVYTEDSAPNRNLTHTKDSALLSTHAGGLKGIGWTALKTFYESGSLTLYEPAACWD